MGKMCLLRLSRNCGEFPSTFREESVCIQVPLEKPVVAGFVRKVVIIYGT
jgi:hypothetical protein